MFAQPPPSGLQRCHWNVRVIVGAPIHVPAVAVSDVPTVMVAAVVEIVGSTVFVGVFDATTSVASEVAVAGEP